MAMRAPDAAAVVAMVAAELRLKVRAVAFTQTQREGERGDQRRAASTELACCGSDWCRSEVCINEVGERWRREEKRRGVLGWFLGLGGFARTGAAAAAGSVTASSRMAGW